MQRFIARNVLVLVLIAGAGGVGAGYAQVVITLKPKPLSPLQIAPEVYAACTQMILKTLGAPPKTAAHFENLWVAHAYACAMNGGEMR